MGETSFLRRESDVSVRLTQRIDPLLPRISIVDTGGRIAQQDPTVQLRITATEERPGLACWCIHTYEDGAAASLVVQLQCTELASTLRPQFAH